jgi:hypothetical protein
MKKIIVPAIAMTFAATCATSALAQGQGGYGPGVPGGETAAAPSHAVKHMRARHATNDTAGGISSIDKSGNTQEGGRAVDGAQGQDQALGAHAPGNTGASTPNR